MIKLIFFTTIIIQITNTYCAEVYFSPSNDCENHIVENIQNSKKTIDIAVYAINNDKIVNALIEANKKSDIKIRILSDSIQAAGKSSKIPQLYKSGLNIKIHSVNKIMHNKFAIFDKDHAVNGSYNWTNPASVANNENCVFFDAKEDNIIKKYDEEFERLWIINSIEKSQKKISRILENN